MTKYHKNSFVKEIENMLFLTVYGPELESIFLYINKFTQQAGCVDREQLYSAYLPHAAQASRGQTKNIDDAVNYLKATGLIGGDSTYFSIRSNLDIGMPFAALLLRQFRQLEHHSPQLPPLDLLYATLLEQLFILPDRVWISDVHAAVNQLELAQQVGGVSQEKIGAWKRAMEFLGIGYRMSSGFYCLYQPKLLHAIARRWMMTEGTLQEFFEEHLQTWIPSLTARGEAAQSVFYALEQLEQDGKIRLLPKQDSPSRPYFGTRCMRGIELV
jgi:hypothetical protein